MCSLVQFSLMIQLGSGLRYFTEKELGEPEFDWNQLEVKNRFMRNNKECHHVREEVTIYEVPLLRNGNKINSSISVVNTFEVDKMSIFYNQEEFSGGDIFIRPRLNCYPQDDPRLIEAIKEHFLHPPSVGPYNLEGLRTDADGQPLMLDQRFFNEKKKGGFFIEAGAWDGEADSTSLHFELKYGWTGLLVEPLPNKFQSLLKKNRKAWAVQTCLSTQQTPETVDFSTTSSSKNTIGGILNSSDEKVKDVRMQCLPLYSILLALGNPTVDFLSLDIEGAEYQILKNIPWKYVDIKAISVETQFAGEVFEGDRDDIFDLLTSVGYTHLDTIARDDVFVKLEPNQTTPNQDIRKVLERKSKRVCSYFKVPFDKLSEHCKSMYPLDYFDKVKTENLPECLTRRMCPYDIHSLVGTYKISSSWIITLSDGCMYR